MLNWYEKNGKHLGFDDDTLVYIVDCDIQEGWRWLDVHEDYGVYGYANAEEARAGAENDYARFHKILAEESPLLTPEEMLEVLDDMLYEERRDARLCK